MPWYTYDLIVIFSWQTYLTIFFISADTYSYGALFGPQTFGHGHGVESHKSFGKLENKTCGGITRQVMNGLWIS